MRQPLLVGVALSIFASAASAQVVASDDFSYVGALTANGWTAHSGAGNKVVMSDGSVATLDQSSGSGEDVSLPFTAFGAADTIYASFDLTLPSGQTVDPDGSGLYFAHFKDSGFAFRARTGVLSPAGGGDFALALNADSSDLGAGVSWPSDLSFDTTYKVVISWNAGTGEATLWLDPTSMADPSISHTGGFTGDLIETFALRQSNDYTGTQQFDNLIVGNDFDDVLPPPPVVPTVSEWGLIVMGLLFLIGGTLVLRRTTLAVEAQPSVA